MKVVAVLALMISLVSLTTGQTSNNQYKRVCYFANWAFYREGSGKYWVDKLDPFECTHIIYAFAVLDKQTYEMKVFDTWADLDNGGYSTVVGLKRQNPALKTLIALGGWNDSQFSTQYSEMVSDPVLRANFVAKALAFVRQYGFDGLDFDWEYPGDPGNPETDKANFVAVLAELKAAFQPYGLLLSMAPSCSIKRAELGYDIREMGKIVDFVNFMSYDIHGAWEKQTDHHAPLYRRSWDEKDAVIIHEAVNFWLDQGFPKEKLIFGIPSYGRAFRLANKDVTGILAPAIGAATAGKYTREDGFLSLYEICELQQSGWIVTTDPTGAMGPYAHNNYDWVAWDDIDTAITKVKYAMGRNLGGIMVWELGLDDFNGFCNMGKRPLLRAINATLHGLPFDTSTPAPTPSLYPRTTTAAMSKCTNEGGYSRDPTDCNKYYRCVNGQLMAHQCPPTLAFDEKLTVCNHPAAVPGCENCCKL